MKIQSRTRFVFRTLIFSFLASFITWIPASAAPIGPNPYTITSPGFNAISAGEVDTEIFTITYTGSESPTIVSLATTDSDYVIGVDNCSGYQFPINGTSYTCTVSVIYSPTQSPAPGTLEPVDLIIFDDSFSQRNFNIAQLKTAPGSFPSFTSVVYGDPWESNSLHVLFDNSSNVDGQWGFEYSLDTGTGVTWFNPDDGNSGSTFHCGPAVVATNPFLYDCQVNGDLIGDGDFAVSFRYNNHLPSSYIQHHAVGQTSQSVNFHSDSRYALVTPGTVTVAAPESVTATPGNSKVTFEFTQPRIVQENHFVNVYYIVGIEPSGGQLTWDTQHRYLITQGETATIEVNNLTNGQGYGIKLAYFIPDASNNSLGWWNFATYDSNMTDFFPLNGFNPITPTLPPPTNDTGLLRSGSIADVKISIREQDFQFYDLIFNGLQNSMDLFGYRFLINESKTVNAVTNFLPAEEDANVVVKKFDLGSLPVDEDAFNQVPVSDSFTISDGDLFIVQVSEPNSAPGNLFHYYLFVAATYSVTGPDFNDTPIGDIYTADLTITNSGQENIYFEPAAIDSSTAVPLNPYTANNTDFSIDQTDGFDACSWNSAQRDGDPLYSGSDCTISIFFSPTLIDQETATMVLMDNNGNQEPINLTGRGLDAPNGGLAAPSLTNMTVQIVADNNFAILMGDSSTVTRVLYQNPVAWPTQIESATSLSVVGLSGDTYLYVLAMGGGGVEDWGGRINGLDIQKIPGAQAMIDSSTITNQNDIYSYIDLGPSITGFAENQEGVGDSSVANGGFSDPNLLDDVKSAMTGAYWYSALKGDTHVPTPVYSQVSSTPSTRSWAFPTGTAALFRYPLDGAGVPFSVGDEQVTVRWRAATGGTHATAYYVYYKESSQPDSAYLRFGPVSTTSATITGLTNSETYTFVIQATNARGDLSPLSSAREATPVGPVRARQVQTSVSTPTPQQQSTISSLSPVNGSEGTETEVRVNGNFVEAVSNIEVNGKQLPSGSWKQTPTSITFMDESRTAGSYPIQIFNGSAPMLPIQTLVIKEKVAVLTPVPVVTPEKPTSIPETKPTDTTTVVLPTTPKQISPVKLKVKVYFDMASFKLVGSNINKIKELARSIKSLKGKLVINIVGFAQPTPGSEKTDLQLSKNRASAVTQLLKKYGVSAPIKYLGAGRASLNVPSSRYVEITVESR